MADESGLEEPWFTNGDIRLQAVAAGPQDGPLVILLHGFPEFVVNFLNGLVERCFEDPVPDVIPHTDRSAIEFSHVFLEADSERDAYNRGWKMLPPRKRGTVANDYVVVVG
jgi:hypothetical protein